MPVEFNPITCAITTVAAHQRKSLDCIAAGIPQSPSGEIRSLERLLLAANVLHYAIRHCEHQMSDADYREISVWYEIASEYLGIL